MLNIDLKSDLSKHKRCFLAPQEADAVQWTGKNSAHVMKFLDRFDKNKALRFRSHFRHRAPGIVFMHINGVVLELQESVFRKLTRIR